VISVDDDRQVLLDEYEKPLNPRTRLVSAAQVSNALGTVLPTQAIVAAAHRYGARVLVNGAQSVSHLRTDVQALDCDFFVFIGHKVFGPTGIGAVYGKPDALAEAPPWQGGGNMIVDVTFEETIYHRLPPGLRQVRVTLPMRLDWPQPSIMLKRLGGKISPGTSAIC
jgi:cysteine desulfurase / selenocysteine lyase